MQARSWIGSDLEERGGCAAVDGVSARDRCAGGRRDYRRRGLRRDHDRDGGDVHHRGVGGKFEIGIGQHDHVVLGAAQRLHALGVVNRLTPPGTALIEALALAARLNAKAPNALASIKELMNDAPQLTLTAQLAQERDQFVRNLHHPNAGIGIEAFLAKQTPRYE